MKSVLEKGLIRMKEESWLLKIKVCTKSLNKTILFLNKTKTTKKGGQNEAKSEFN